MSLISLSDGATTYELTGEAGQALTVLIHGFSVPSYIWEPTFQNLKQTGFHVLRYDLYGRGYSDRPEVDYSVELFVRQLTELLDALVIETPVNLIGLSMGGPIAAAFCERFPERVGRLALIDPAGFKAWKSLSLSVLRIPGLGEWVFKRNGPDLIVNSQRDDFYQPERFPGYGGLARPQMLKEGYFRALLSTLRKGPLGDLSELYRQVGAQARPVLLIWGAEDRTFPVALGQKALRLMTRASLQVIPEAGHIPHYERPELVNPLLVEFLR